MAMSRRESFSIRFIPYSPKKLRYDDVVLINRKSRSSFVTVLSICLSSFPYLACSKPSRVRILRSYQSSRLIRHFIKEGQNGRTE
ncbi:hypothetical protein BDN70DRAFT_886219 [Pholiota conissans]|uniref:Uncharacterized protein n=1 Tax=Pholiota conissans TaxID=109636 RepID=A0A9P5YQ79_9AGAR|nr:hypothetical protein BDN70DRAFT_886219 [Pholiota conissans]